MSGRKPNRWVPAVILAAGCGLLALSQRQQVVPLARPLSEFPREMLGYQGRDAPISTEEQRIAGMSSFVLRAYYGTGPMAVFSVYVGYYESQSQGKSIHSPKNCLPGAGWEPLASGIAVLESPAGRFGVNRYVLANDSLRALVYYWYQGRGRVQANEYTVKWNLLHDKAISGRSEETLVRIVVPIASGKIAAADSLASRIGARLIGEVQRHLPDFPGRSIAGG